MCKNFYCYVLTGVLLCLYPAICFATAGESFPKINVASKIPTSAVRDVPSLWIYDMRQTRVLFDVAHEAGSVTEIYKSTQPESEFVLAGTYSGPSGGIWEDENLRPRTHYYFKARSLKDGVYTDYSEVVDFYSQSDWFPPEFTAVATSPYTIELTLTDRSYQEANYEIIIDDPNYYFHDGIVMEDSGRTVKFTVNGLDPNKTFSFSVDVSLNEEGGTFLDDVATASATTPYDVVEITNIIPHVTYARVDVDNDNPGTSTQLYRSLSPDSGYELVGSKPGFEESFEDRNLTPGTTYFYKARASETNGTSSPYSSVKAVTTIPLYYPTLTARALNETTIELSLTDNSSVEVEYEILSTSPSSDNFNQRITMPDSGTTVTFIHDSVNAGVMYTYVVDMILDNDEEIFYAVDTVSVTTSGIGACDNAGSIEREVWNNISGTDVAAIPLNTTPSAVTTLTLFEAPSNQGSNYGARVRGYICPPATGNYTFWIASDDKSELWLSTDENAEHKTKIASVNAHTAIRQWDRYPAQKSAVIHLEQGNRYYIEALHKEASGGDNLAVGWQLPDGTMERPIAGNRLIPYTNSTSTSLEIEIIEPTSDMKFDEPANIYIHAFPYDNNDTTARITKVEFYNGATKLGEDSTYRHEFSWWNVPQGTYTIIAKVYNDKGATNTAQVTITVSAPTCSGEEGAGYLDREIWRNISGTSVGSIPVNSEPDQETIVTSFETGTYFANNYGDRIRGYVCVPVTGNYTFWIASDDNSELWLSTDYTEGNKVKIASVTGATNVRQWTKYASQRSAPVHLKAGYKYYIETLHKEANGNDHVAVGWQLPDGTLERPIPGNRLIAYYVYNDYPLPQGISFNDARVKSDDVQEEEDDSHNVITLSPNPVTDREVVLGTTGTKISNLHEAQVKVISMRGEVVHTETINCEGGDCSSAPMIFRNDLLPGIYMVNVMSNGKRWATKLIVK